MMGLGGFGIACAWPTEISRFFLLSLFVEPLPFDQYWLIFLMPLIVAVSVVYKTIKLEDLSLVPRSAGILALQIVVFMALAAVVLGLIVRFMAG